MLVLYILQIYLTNISYKYVSAVYLTNISYKYVSAVYLTNIINNTKEIHNFVFKHEHNCDNTSNKVKDQQ